MPGILSSRPFAKTFMFGDCAESRDECREKLLTAKFAKKGRKGREENLCRFVAVDSGRQAESTPGHPES
jgi:hypothetical protein